MIGFVNYKILQESSLNKTDFISVQQIVILLYNMHGTYYLVYYICAVDTIAVRTVNAKLDKRKQIKSDLTLPRMEETPI